MVDLENWNGRVYKVSRDALSAFAARPDAKHTGIYFLFGRNPAMEDTVYVGEAEKMVDRLRQHVNDREYWNDCVAIISKDDHLNKAHVKYLEHEFFHLAQDAGRYHVTNANIPTRSSVSEFDVAMLREFIAHTMMLVGTLGYKVFDPIVRPILPGQTAEIFYIKAVHGADGKGVRATDGFTVMAGSVISFSTTPSFPSALLKLRQKLLAGDIVNESFCFTRDYLFSSPSTAASIVMGRNANGLIEWKTADGRMLKSIEEAQLNA